MSKLMFTTENCEDISLDIKYVGKIEVDGKEVPLTVEDFGKLNLNNIIIYLNNPQLEYFTQDNYTNTPSPNEEAIKRLKGNDITWISFLTDDDNKGKSFQPLLWETDAVLTSHQYTALQRLVEYNGKYAFVHNATQVDMDYFFGDEE